MPVRFRVKWLFELDPHTVFSVYMLIIDAVEKSVISIKKTLFFVSAPVARAIRDRDLQKGSFLCCNLFN